MFRFRLETLCKLREQARDERRRDLAQAYEAEQVLRERRRLIDEEIEQTRERARNFSRERDINVDELSQTRRYELVLKAQATANEKQLSDVLAELERRRQALLEADREVKVLEKLRERGQEQYTLKELQRESKELDEAAIRGFARQEVAS